MEIKIPQESTTATTAVPVEQTIASMAAEAERQYDAAMFEAALRRAYREWLLTEKDIVN